MAFRQTLLSSAALLVISGPQMAFAEVTAQDVWTDWKKYLEDFGYGITSSEATSGDTLTVSDLVMTVELPEGEGAVSMSLGEMTFTNQAGGSVAVGIAESLPIAFKFKTEKDEPVEGVVDYNNTDLSIIVSGDPSNMTYTYSAATLDMIVKSVMVDGTTIPINAINVMLKDVAGTAAMKVGNMRDVTQTFTAASMTYDVDIPPIEGNTFKMAGGLNALSFDGTGSYPMGIANPQDFSSMLKAGFSFNGGFAYEGGNTKLNFNEDGKTTEGESSTDSGSLTVAMDESQLHYSGKTKGLRSMMVGAGLPLPIEINSEESAFNIKMPVAPGDDAQEFELGILLGGFTTSEMLWGMVDPSQQLPRDPATLNIDLAGKAKLLLDMFDPAEAAKMEDGSAPGEIESLDIRAIRLNVAGADLTGKGAFTFDNTDMETIPGMPKPEGAVELKLVGGNGLLDKLVAMGLLPEDQAMGARMMMGLFAVPGEGEDTLNSKIEVNDQGHVLANGQRLR